jgi:hypothetical protein
VLVALVAFVRDEGLDVGDLFVLTALVEDETLKIE